MARARSGILRRAFLGAPSIPLRARAAAPVAAGAAGLVCNKDIQCNKNIQLNFGIDDDPRDPRAPGIARANEEKMQLCAALDGPAPELNGVLQANKGLFISSYLLFYRETSFANWHSLI